MIIWYDQVHITHAYCRRQLHSADSRTCVVRRSHSNLGGCRCFAAAGARLWNSLPAGLRQTDIGYEWFKWLLFVSALRSRHAATICLNCSSLDFLTYLVASVYKFTIILSSFICLMTGFWQRHLCAVPSCCIVCNNTFISIVYNPFHYLRWRVCDQPCSWHGWAVYQSACRLS